MNFGESLGSLEGCEGLEVADQEMVRKAQKITISERNRIIGEKQGTRSTKR